jgi:predicted RNA-binding protein with RPS1 domain
MAFSNYDHVKPLEDFDWSQYTNDKYNTSIVLTEEDKKARVKILCKEPYAQELYDKMVAWEGKSGSEIAYDKDFKVGQLYTVEAKSISFDLRAVVVEEVNTLGQIIVPFKEFSGDLDELAKGNLDAQFRVILYKQTGNGEYLASERKCRAINFAEELLQHQKNNTWFEVKIKSLIKGGYLATYKDEVKCFIPGSHAGANVIHDFSTLLGKTINVMVDNYDKSNSLFILSYKKYVTQSLPIKISDLRFNKKYTGKLTTRPYDFGMFIEFEGYYTGLLHSSEFKDYNKAKNEMKTGDEVSFWIKDVNFKKRQYRIVLTLNENSISKNMIGWDNTKEELEGKLFDFELSENQKAVVIETENGPIELGLNRLYKDKDLSTYSKVSIIKVDSINKTFNYRLIS